MHYVADCIGNRIRFAIPQPTEWQRIGNQIEAAFVFSVLLWPAWEQIHDHCGSKGSEHKDATDD